jgi:hypothetical protein
VSVFFTKVVDVGGGRLEHPQAKQSEKANKREVVAVVGVSARGQQCFELEMCQAEGVIRLVLEGGGHTPLASARALRR